LTSVRTVDPHSGDWLLNSSAGFNSNHNHVNAAAKQASRQTTSRPHQHATPKSLYTKQCVPVSIPICEISEIKNQKEWHWPPNIDINKLIRKDKKTTYGINELATFLVRPWPVRVQEEGVAVPDWLPEVRARLQNKDRFQ
jgi:hypothetical protein